MNSVDRGVWTVWAESQQQPMTNQTVAKVGSDMKKAVQLPLSTGKLDIVLATLDEIIDTSDKHGYVVQCVAIDWSKLCELYVNF